LPASDDMPISWVLGWSAPEGHPARLYEAAQFSPRIIGRETYTDRVEYMSYLLSLYGFSHGLAAQIAREIVHRYPACAEDECDKLTAIIDTFGDHTEFLTAAQMVTWAIQVLRWHYSQL